METKIIIPLRDNDGSDNAPVLDRAIRALCGQFGGATVYGAKGYWLNDEGRLFVDDVAVIVSSATDADTARRYIDLGARYIASHAVRHMADASRRFIEVVLE